MSLWLLAAITRRLVCKWPGREENRLLVYTITHLLLQALGRAYPLKRSLNQANISGSPVQRDDGVCCEMKGVFLQRL